MKQGNIFEKNPIKTIVVTVFSALLIIDITAANLNKHFFSNVFHDKGQHNSQEIEKTYRVVSNIYHHDLAKNVYLENAIWGDAKYTVATDSLGFRSEKPRDIPMISKKYRMVFIGDSFTEGIGIQYQDSFVGRIAETLLEKNIEVLNAAVSSYSPIIYYRKIKHILDLEFNFDELVVFIDISDVVDEANHYEMSPSNTVRRKENSVVKLEKVSMGWKLKTMVKSNSIMSYFILNKIHDFLFNNEPKSQINRRRSMWTIDRSIFEEYGNEGLKKSAFYMTQLSNLLKQNNITLTIAVYPWPDQIFNNDLDSIQVRYWRNWAQHEQVNFLNYFPCFVNQSSQNPASNSVTLESYFFKGDVHWNDKGHELIASEFISYYSRQNGKCTDRVRAASHGVPLQQ